MNAEGYVPDEAVARSVSSEASGLFMPDIVPIDPSARSQEQKREMLDRQRSHLDPVAPTAPQDDDPNPKTWKDKANCYGSDTGVFYPSNDASVDVPKRVCGDCPVKVECLEFALSNNEVFGVWGGTSERERRRIKRSRREAGQSGNQT